MKTLRFIGMALLAMILCVNFAACSDDDEPQATSKFIGTVWRGTNPITEFVVEVSVTSNTKCIVTAYQPDGTTLYDRQECAYIYKETTGEFSCAYDGYTITGKIEGNTMELTDKFGTYTLTKQ